MSLDTSETNPAYRLGRLFAVLESTQRAALGKVNASIRERYFASASTTPSSAFPLLLRGVNHHLSKLRKEKSKTGLGIFFEKEIGEILSGLEGEFPRNLKIDDQGRFVIGYYHQRCTKRRDVEESGAGEFLQDRDDTDDTDDT